MAKRILVVALVVMLLVAGWVVWLVTAAGQFKTLEPVGSGDCLRIEGPVGAEDLTVDAEAALVVISADDRRAAAAGEVPSGALWTWSPSSGAQRLEAGIEDFRPHGLSLWRPSDETGGEPRLFVVDHGRGGHAVQLFAWNGQSVVHLQTVTGDLLISPNDVAAVGPDAFYVTNDHGSRTALGRALEDYLRLAGGNVVYWDGERMRVVADGIAYANGIAVSPDGEEVYVASTTRGTLHRFRRERENGALQPIDVLELGTGVDNIEVDAAGDLWVGAHPKLLSFVAHAGDPTKLSPSEVLWVDPYRSADPWSRVIWRDLGERLSGLSVAAPWGDRLILGSVFEPGFLVCRLESPLR